MKVATLMRRVLWVSAALVLCAGHANAQTRCEGTAREPIQLTAAQVHACITGLMWIDHAAVQGADVISAIRESSRGSVRIRRSTVQGGLYFSSLKAATIDTLTDALPAARPGESRECDPGCRLMDLLKSYAFQPNESVRVVRVPIELEDVLVEAGTDFDNSEYGPIAIQASRVVFARGFKLTKGSRIAGAASFSRAVFAERSLFDGAHFSGPVTFDAAGFSDGASFGFARFERTTLFTYTRFDGKADFPHSQFAQELSFEKARFCEPVDFADAEFVASAHFAGAQLASDAVFSRARFSGGADFASAHVRGEMTLAMARMQGVMTFSNARIHDLKIGSAGQRSRIEAELYFSDAWMAAASFREIRLDAPVSFARARFGPAGFDTDVYKFNTEPRMRRSAARAGCGAGHPVKMSGLRRVSTASSSPVAPPSSTAAVSLRDVDFYDRVTFQDSEIQSPTNFDGVTFRGGANLLGVRFVVNRTGPDVPVFPMAGLPFQSLDMDWESVAEFAALDSHQRGAPASQQLQQIEGRFQSQGQLAAALAARRAARWAQVREGRACVRAWLSTPNTPSTATPCDDEGGVGEALRRVTFFPIWGLQSAFSTSLPRLLVVIVLVHLVFAWIYFRSARILRRVPPKGESIPGIRLHPLALPFTFAPNDLQGRWTSMRGIGTALTISALVLLRFGRGDLVVNGSVRGVDLRYLVALQWALGIPLLIDLVYTLSETQPFLQRLLTGTIG